MAKVFEFVDGTKTDRSTRRFARSHAMKGKNVGKTHHRRSRLRPNLPPKCDQPIALLSTSSPASSKATEWQESGSTSPLAPQILVPQPVPLPQWLNATPKNLDIIKMYFTSVVEAVFPLRLCLSIDHVKSYWLQMMFMDKTSYHCSLALMSTLNEFVFAGDTISLDANYHLGRAISLVNQKLGTAEALSDSNLSVVNFLVIRDMYGKEQASAEIHLRGLQRMLELRGGIDQLEDTMLAFKIYKTDIDFAFLYGTTTSFYRDGMPQASRIMNLDEPNFNPCSAKRLTTLIDPFLEQILKDSTRVSHWFDKDENRLHASAEALHEVVVSVGYRLVRFHSLNEPPLENSLEAVYHIGLVAFLTTLFLQFGRRRFLRYGLVSRCLKNVIRQRMELPRENQDALLWLLFVGGISVLTESDKSWLLPQIVDISQSLRAQSWAEVHRILDQFPWMRPLHDEPGEALWAEAMTIKIQPYS